MDREEPWILYLPIGTVESERLLFVMEFLSTKSLEVFFIHVTPHRLPNDEFKNFDKLLSESSKRSITSTDKSHLSEEKSFSDGSHRNVNISMETRPTALGSNANFDKRVTPDSLGRRATIPNASQPAPQKKWIQLFYPTLRVNENVYIQNQHLICFALLENFGTGSKLGLLTDNRRAIQEQIQRIEERIDVHVRRLMSFIYLNSIDPEGVIKDEDSKRVTLNWNSYQLTLDLLIKELDLFYNKCLVHRTVTPESELTLTDVYLVTALNRVFKFLFDPNFSKSWISNITSWFHKVSKRKDFENVFGKFRVCKVNYTSLLRDIEAENPPNLHSDADAGPPRLEDIKRHVRQVTDRCRSSDLLSHLDFGLFQQLVFEGFKGDNFYLWTFAYIPIEEDPRTRKGSNKTQDEVSEFFQNFCDAADKDIFEFVLYIVQGSRCENLQGFVNTKKNFEACKTHFGNYFVGSDIKGLVLTQSPELPKFIRLYEEKDILEVKYVSQDQNAKLEEALRRQGEFATEKVIAERIF
jgi:hypothetical protein